MDIAILARCIATLAATSICDDIEDLIDQADLIAFYIETGKRPHFHNPEAEDMVNRCIDAARKKRNGEAA